jgi:hypothetical protein
MGTGVGRGCRGGADPDGGVHATGLVEGGGHLTAHSRRQVGATRPAGTRGNFPRLFARVSFVRSPRARPERPGMAWARRMDEGPDPGEIEDPGTRLGRFSPSG